MVKVRAGEDFHLTAEGGKLAKMRQALPSLQEECQNHESETIARLKLSVIIFLYHTLNINLRCSSCDPLKEVKFEEEPPGRLYGAHQCDHEEALLCI